MTFNEPVLGVEAEDLLVGGEPAASVSASGNTYTFQFSTPLPGFVSVYFDVDHGITDLAGNAFNESAPGATWFYQINDTTAPVLAITAPPAGAVFRTLTEAWVSFSEPVQGVDAGDLLVNSVAATNVTGVGPGPYHFLFSQPVAGSVAFSWAAGHGIADLASNAFGGAGWTTLRNPTAPMTVRINEFLAANESATGYIDEDGERHDWIELYNHGPSAVNLAGWSLTNDPENPGQWMLPNVSLNPGAYLIVFASGKDRRNPTLPARLHSNFQLGTGGEYLALFSPDGPREAVSELQFPEQRINYSFGYDGVGGLRYFSTPTPGAPNGNSSIEGVAAPVHFSVARGFFDAPFQLVLTATTPGAAIRYTTDGSPPAADTGFVYSGPLTISNTTPLRAAAFKTNFLPSVARTHTYVFPDQALKQPNNPAGFPSTWVTQSGSVVVPADYAMDPRIVNSPAYTNLARQAMTSIPSLSVVMRTGDLFSQVNGIYSNPRQTGITWERPASAEFLFVDGTEAVQVDAGYRIQGGTSREENKVHKHSQRLLFRGSYGAGKLDYPLFADSSVQSYDTLLVDAGLNLVWIHRTDATQRRQGQYVRDQFVSDLQNAMGWPAFHGRFFHLYLNGLYWGLHGIHERPDEDFAASYFGGDKDEWDIIKNTTSFEAVYGDFAAWNAMRALASSGLTNDAQYQQIQLYLDVPSLIDYMILNIYVGNTDWPHHNWYVGRRKPSGTFKFFNWDAEHVLKDASYNNSTVANANTPAEFYDQLRRYNREFRLRFADHVHKHFFNDGICTTNQALARYMARIREIDPAIVLESARWGDNAANADRPGQPYERNVEWVAELTRLTNTWFPRRSTNVLNQFRNLGLYPTLAAPVFSRHGGRVARGFSLTMSAAAGSIYFTTNGVDPRVYGAGTPAPDAQLYSGAVSISRSTVVKARTMQGTNWSALNAAQFTVAQAGSPLRITEIMYSPPGGDAYEFIEIRNVGEVDLDLSGYSLEGVTFVFPAGFILPAGAAIVLASNDDPVAFAARYPGVNVAGYFADRLANGGERIAIKDATGQIVTSVEYDDENGWPTAPDGGGYSLEIRDAFGNPDDPANWRASISLNGSPGTAPAEPSPADVMLNELMAENGGAVTNDGAFPDWIELRNGGSSAVNLSGWSLSDDGDPRKFTFPEGTIIVGNGHLVIWCDAATNAPGLHSGFPLSVTGGSVFLYDAGTNRVDAISYGAQLATYTIGRIGADWKLNVPTPGAANQTAATASPANLFINEWLANAPPGGSDWVELYNAANQPLALRDISLATSNAIFQMQALSFLPAQGFVQILADEVSGLNHVDFKLPAAGGAIVLLGSDGSELNRVVYGAQTESVSQGRLPDGGAAIQSFPGSASPGAPNYVISWAGPFLHEVMARNAGSITMIDGTPADWVELRNPFGTNVNISGMRLAVDAADPNQWSFPAGTSIPANGYLVVWCTSARPASTVFEAELNTGHGIDGDSGGVFLFNSAGQLGDSVEFGFQVEDQTMGRAVAGWQLLTTPTPGASNAPAATLGAVNGLVINEWMASPTNGADWFELFNSGPAPVSLSGLFVTDDPSIFGQAKFAIAPLSFIGAGSWARFVADDDPGQGRHHVNFRMDELGETLRLYAGNLQLIDAVNFGLGEAGVSEGRLPDGSENFVKFPGSPTPGRGNYLSIPNIVINEVLPVPNGNTEQAIEIYSLTPHSIDFSGWFLTDTERVPKKFRLPSPTSIAGGGYRVFYEEQFGANSSGVPITLHAGGGEVWLFEADAAGNLSGRRVGARYGTPQPGQSWGRAVGCNGPDFVALSNATFGVALPANVAEFRTGGGAANAPPANASTNEPSGAPTITEQPLSRVVLAGNPVEFQAGACPSAVTYQWHFGTAALSNATNRSYRIASAQSQDVGTYFVVATNAFGAATSAVAQLSFGTPPVITSQPEDVRTNTGSVAVFTVGATGGPLIYQWRFNSLAIPGGTNSELSIADVKLKDAGDYSVLVGNQAGEIASATARLTLTLGLQITSHPSSLSVSPGTNVTFSVAAIGTGQLRYQWVFNSNILASATNSFLTVTNVSLVDHGTYWVEVSDENGTVRSESATLTVRVSPSISQAPASVTVLEGDDVTLSVVATGTPPLGYRWRHNGGQVGFKVGDPTFTITNVQTAHAGSYQVIVTNLVNTIGVISAPATLTVLVHPSLLGPKITNGFFEVLLRGSTGKTHVVESSVNLSNWTEMITLTPTNVETRVSEPAAGNRFYRVRLIQ
ncbi:MAG: lamin tail domain-containing protein [Verrucomicrobia subdivision 3 bacterium]|nr:lamin tail domain-containing protein [Limisphaerales bacterium]